MRQVNEIQCFGVTIGVGVFEDFLLDHSFDRVYSDFIPSSLFNFLERGCIRFDLSTTIVKNERNTFTLEDMFNKAGFEKEAFMCRRK